MVRRGGARHGVALLLVLGCVGSQAFAESPVITAAKRLFGTVLADGILLPPIPLNPIPIILTAPKIKLQGNAVIATSPVTIESLSNVCDATVTINDQGIAIECAVNNSLLSLAGGKLKASSDYAFKNPVLEGEASVTVAGVNLTKQTVRLEKAGFTASFYVLGVGLTVGPVRNLKDLAEEIKKAALRLLNPLKLAYAVAQGAIQAAQKLEQALQNGVSAAAAWLEGAGAALLSVGSWAAGVFASVAKALESLACSVGSWLGISDCKKKRREQEDQRKDAANQLAAARAEEARARQSLAAAKKALADKDQDAALDALFRGFVLEQLLKSASLTKFRDCYNDHWGWVYTLTYQWVDKLKLGADQRCNIAWQVVPTDVRVAFEIGEEAELVGKHGYAALKSCGDGNASGAFYTAFKERAHERYIPPGTAVDENGYALERCQLAAARVPPDVLRVAEHKALGPLSWMSFDKLMRCRDRYQADGIATAWSTARGVAELFHPEAGDEEKDAYAFEACRREIDGRPTEALRAFHEQALVSKIPRAKILLCAGGQVDERLTGTQSVVLASHLGARPAISRVPAVGTTSGAAARVMGGRPAAIASPGGLLSARSLPAAPGGLGGAPGSTGIGAGGLVPVAPSLVAGEMNDAFSFVAGLTFDAWGGLVAATAWPERGLYIRERCKGALALFTPKQRTAAQVTAIQDLQKSYGSSFAKECKLGTRLFKTLGYVVDALMPELSVAGAKGPKLVGFGGGVKVPESAGRTQAILDRCQNPKKYVGGGLLPIPSPLGGGRL